MTATRRQVLAGAGTALAGGLAGCISGPPCIDYGEERALLESVVAGYSWLPSYVDEIDVRFAFVTGGSFELWVVDIPPAAPLLRQDVPPERQRAVLHPENAKTPLAIEARGHDDRLLDRVEIRAPGECSGGGA